MKPRCGDRVMNYFLSHLFVTWHQKIKSSIIIYIVNIQLIPAMIGLMRGVIPEDVSVCTAAVSNIVAADRMPLL